VRVPGKIFVGIPCGARILVPKSLILIYL